MAVGQERDFTFTWTIKHFNFFDRIYCECLSSPTFKIESFENSEWRVCLYPRTVSEEIECQLQRRSSGNNPNCESMCVCFRYELSSKDGVILKQSELLRETFKEDSYSEIFRLMELEELMTEVSKWSDDTVIFRCHLTNKKDLLPSKSSKCLVSGCEIETDIRSHTPLYVWFFKFLQTQNWTASKEIKLRNITIFVTLKYVNDEIQIDLNAHVEDELTHCYLCNVKLIDAMGNEVIDQSDRFEFTNKHNIRNLPSFISKQHLTEAECFLRQEIKIKFCIWYLYCLTSKINYCNESLTGSLMIGSMSTDIENSCSDVLQNTVAATGCFPNAKNYLKHSSLDKTLTDVKLWAGNQYFPAHKSLLAAHSTIFTEMFELTAYEGDAGVIYFHSAEAKIVETFLDYIYSGSMPEFDEKLAANMLIIADMYEILPLRNKCSSFLKSILTIANACEILSTADTVNHEELKTFTMDYLVSNSTKILSSPEWVQWVKKNINLATEVLLNLSKMCNGEP